jgi:predicted N-formylglutamate amidohydrolase
MKPCLLLTCEHASNAVPAEFRALFAKAKSVLNSHRGWDPGSLSMAKIFQRRMSAPLFQTRATRLLVEPNRSIGHARLFSEFTCGLDQQSKQKILARYYFDHRNQVESWIRKQINAAETVLHLSLHTFTPEFAGVVRNADIGLLYDPRRAPEKQFCNAFRTAISTTRPDLRVRRNYPYLGKADGFTTYLRRQFSAGKYLGIELEVNQSLVNPTRSWNQLAKDLAGCLAAVNSP